MKKILLASAAFALIAAPATAKEGMFTPDQLPEIAKDLKKTGLKLNPKNLTDLTAFPMGAVVSLGGCSASFVSRQGLAVTNHHCARGSVQFNSTEENNYLENGFLAKTMEAELPAAPGSRIYVTVKVDDVTDKILAGLGDDLSGRARYDAIQDQKKALIKSCEAVEGHRCQVPAFHGGLQYKLIDRLEIRDVRLVYAPADAIGKYGGDIDNWMWPRHTGDFSFYRAYVAPDGSSADFAKENVPFVPAHTLKVSAAGLKDGDFVMAAGYPGSTSRYARLGEVENTFDWRYPSFVTLLEDWIGTIEATAPEGSDARIKYESRLASLNNFMKNLRGQIEGAKRVDLVGRRKMRETELNAWIAADKSRADYAGAITKLDALSEESALKQRQDFYFNNATRPQLLSAAQRLYKLAQQKTMPDAKRDSGYQERDMNFFKQGMERIDRRYDADVDKAEWMMFIKSYMARPASERVEAFDKALGLGAHYNESVVSAKLSRYYAETKLSSKAVRIAMMDADVAKLDGSADPFMKLAAALYATELAAEESKKDRSRAAAPLCARNICRLDYRLAKVQRLYGLS